MELKEFGACYHFESSFITSTTEPVGPQASHPDQLPMQIVRAKFGIPPYAPPSQALQFIQTNEHAW